MQKRISYTDAMDEIETIVSNLEAGTVSIDELATSVRRATELIGICRGHLRQANTEVEKALAQLKDDAAEAAQAQAAPCPPATDQGLFDDDPFKAS